MWEHRCRVAAVGIGYSKITRVVEEPLGILAVRAARIAIEDAGLEESDIDGLATYPSLQARGQSEEDGIHIVSCDYMILGMKDAPIRWYSDHRSGFIASPLIEAVNAIIAGACNYAIVWRAMHNPRGPYRTFRSDYAAGGAQFTAPYGFATGVQGHALAYQRYQTLYGMKREHMATFVLNSRSNANKNPNAYFYSKPMTFEDYMSVRMIADPLCLYDCDIPVQGAVAVVLTSADRDRDLRHPPAYIAGYGQMTRRKLPLLYYSLEDYMESGGRLVQNIWNMSGLGPKDVDVANLYDGFAPSTIYHLESAGFCKRGEGWQFIQDGRIALDGELPLNTFGGSLSEGRLHGMGHIAESIRQVTGQAGERQVKHAHVALTIDGSPMARGSGVLFVSDPG
jgi:acetyl-CoA acetyltransferase